MLALRYSQEQGLAVQEVPKPQPKQGWALIRVLIAGGGRALQHLWQGCVVPGTEKPYMQCAARTRRLSRATSRATTRPLATSLWCGQYGCQARVTHACMLLRCKC